MFDKVDRGFREYAATRGCEPVRMDSQNQFTPSTARSKRAADMPHTSLGGCAVNRQLYTRVGAVVPRVVYTRTKSSKARYRAPMTFMGKDAREDE